MLQLCPSKGQNIAMLTQEQDRNQSVISFPIHSLPFPFLLIYLHATFAKNALIVNIFSFERIFDSKKLGLPMQLHNNVTQTILHLNTLHPKSKRKSVQTSAGRGTFGD